MAPFAQTTVPAHLRHPGGRPSEYRQEYCEQVIHYMGRGYSLTAFAGSIKVARDTVYEWIKSHREFSDAVARARPARVAALETKLLISRKGAETSAAIFALKNADPTEWRDIKTTEHNHSVRIETLTDAQLFAIASGVSPADAGIIDAEFERVDDQPSQSNER
jgi:hypothetical protein